jgi:hypothetical protein
MIEAGTFSFWAADCSLDALLADELWVEAVLLDELWAR